MTRICVIVILLLCILYVVLLLYFFLFVIIYAFLSCCFSVLVESPDEDMVNMSKHVELNISCKKVVISESAALPSLYCFISLALLNSLL